MIRDERFWIPMLCLLTGARASEIAGLEKPEVTVGYGVDRIVFRVTPLRRLKNKDTERVIPMHPWVMALGFGTYLSSIPATTSFLFPKVVEEARDANGELSDDKLDGSSVFRQFNRTVLKHVGLDRDRTVSLHSFRHVFEDAMTGKNIPDEVMFRLTGRAMGGSRPIYAKSLPADVERQAQRAEEYLPHVTRIDFGGLDLSHLMVARKIAE